MSRPHAAGLTRALDRAAGSPPIDGNTVHHWADAARALDAMVAQIAEAGRSVHLENYIIRHDHTGRRFAAALAERARAGVAVRVLYDALGSRGTRGAFWRGLRRAGVEVRAFHPLLTSGPFDVVQRNHRKLLVTDGAAAMLGGLCIGDEWAGDPARRRRPWRDTMVRLCGPAAAALERTFARTWRRAGPPLPDAELAGDATPCGDTPVRILDGVPGRSRTYRAVQLLVASAAERLWITDAYLVAPPPLYAALVDAARDGVDVRILVPGATDIPLIRALTRIGYRELLHAGARIFEWRGPMLHAKTLVADRRWTRVGSSNLNVSSLLTNYELDVLTDSAALADELAAQFRRDMAEAREVVLVPRRLPLPAKLVGAQAAPPVAAGPHLPTLRERRARAVLALRRVAGGARRMLVGDVALGLAVTAALLLAFPRVMSVALAAGALWLAAGLTWFGVVRRRSRWDDAR